MATYDTPIFTQQSSKLVSAVAANSEQLTFTKIVYSSDDFSNKTDEDISSLTDLNNKEITATAQSFPENGITKVRGAGNNDNLDQGLSIKTFGLYAKGNNIPEMLVAIATSQNADYLDVHNNNASNQLTYTFNLKISNTKNINFSNIHDVSVTQSDLQSAIANIDLSAYAKKEDLNELNKTINESISGPNSTVSQNISAAEQRANTRTNEIKAQLDADIDEKASKNELNNLSDNSMQFKGYLNSNDDLNNMPRESGIWLMFASKPNNMPLKLIELNGGGTWGYVKQTGNNWIKQEVVAVTSNSNNLVAYRMYENSWHDWSYQANTDYVDSKVNSLSNDSLSVKTLSVRDLDYLTQTGLYNFDGSNTYTNIPNNYTSGYDDISVINSNGIVSQTIHSADNVYSRVISSTQSWKHNWIMLANTDEVAQRDKQIEQNAKQYTDEQNAKKIQFFNSLDEAKSSTAPEGTIAIVKG